MDSTISFRNVGKMFKLYQHSLDKVFDVLGMSKYLFWRKNTFREFWALRGFNLDIRKGERVGILGHNGAGKSTLLKMVMGNLQPTEGSITVGGKVQALMELGTGFHPEFTGRQNLRASLSLNGFNRSEIAEKEEEILDFTELEEFIDQPVKTYSSGMYARLAFATATSISPEILIIDEILGAGDAYFMGKCIERMRNITEKSGATVLFVSHDVSSVQRLSNRAIWLINGSLVADGQPVEVVRDYIAYMQGKLTISAPESRPSQIPDRSTQVEAGPRPSENDHPTVENRDNANRPEPGKGANHQYSNPSAGPQDAPSISPDSKLVPAQESKGNPRPVGNSNNTECRIVGLQFLLPDGSDVKSVPRGSNLEVKLHYEAFKPIVDPVFAITFHLTDGSQVDHQNSKLLGAETGTIEGKGSVSFIFNPLRMGVADYFVSAAILKELDLANWFDQPPCYDRHDRLHKIKVVLEPGMEDTGLVIQECEVEHIAEDEPIASEWKQAG